MIELLTIAVIIFTLILLLRILKIVLPIIHRYLLRFSFYRGFISPIKIYCEGFKDVIKECDGMIILVPFITIIYNITFIIAIVKNLFKGGENKC